MSAETWRPIPEYPGYEASDLGHVRSVHRTQPHLMTPWINRGGYPCVNLQVSIDGERKTQGRRVHRLVLMAFVGPSHLEVRHLNGVPGDARLVNLAYGTRSENELDKVRHGGNPTANRTHCARGHELGGDNVFKSTGRRCRACLCGRRALYRQTSAEERAARRAAGMPAVDLDAYFASAVAA